MKILNSKAGVTVLEGVIALGLLAVVTAGAFGVLLSAARKSSQPDMREEMALAVEKAKDRLQVYLNYNEGGKDYLPSNLALGLCGMAGDDYKDQDPLGSGTHNIKCLLPPICDKDATNSEFKYEVKTENLPVDDTLLGGENSMDKNLGGVQADTGLLKITFTIACNGYEL